jgi:uncharacterized membrane protein
MSSYELRQRAWSKLTGNWGGPIAVSLIYAVITGVLSAITQNMPLASLLSILVTAPLAIGLNKYFIQFSRSLSPDVEVLFDGFKESFVSSILLSLLTALFVFLWTLLFIIPGIIKAFAYAMAPYILAENPSVGITEALDQSQEMMKGHKMDLFILGLSFIGWVLLGLITLGIAFIWVAPYISAASAEFYLEVSGGNIVHSVDETEKPAEEDTFDSFLLK